MKLNAKDLKYPPTRRHMCIGKFKYNICRKILICSHFILGDDGERGGDPGEAEGALHPHRRRNLKLRPQRVCPAVPERRLHPRRPTLHHSRKFGYSECLLI